MIGLIFIYFVAVFNTGVCSDSHVTTDTLQLLLWFTELGK